METDTGDGQGLMAADWQDGCLTELAAAADEVENCMKSIRTGVKFPRGYYRFPMNTGGRGNPAPSGKNRAETRF